MIMHNMIVEDEDDVAAVSLEFENVGDPINLLDQNPTTLKKFVKRHQRIWH